VLVSLTAADFLRYISWGVFCLIGFWGIVHAIRRPTPVNIDVALLFGGLAAAIAANALVQFGLIADSRILGTLIRTVIVAMPFLLVRLMDDVIGVPRRIRRLTMVVFVVYVATLWLTPPDMLLTIAIPLVVGLVLLLGYVVGIGLRAVQRTRGITQRRLIAVSLGSLFLALNFIAGRLPLAPEDTRSLVDLFGVTAGISYYIGFAPPHWLRQLWQGPELRAFLVRSAGLPQMADSSDMYRAVERGAAAALGAPYASIGLWDERNQALVFPTAEAPVSLSLSTDLPVTRAFRTQKAVFSRNVTYDPELDAQFRLQSRVRVALAAPISSANQRFGVLTVYGPRVSLFADDDLTLLQLMADQTAISLEGRRLNERAALIRAREESTRLKEDFLSAAAHDFKTPLTTLVIQAQLSERRAVRNPAAPADLVGLRRIVAQGERLRATILDLLDAARAEQQQLIGRREPVDLVACLHEMIKRHASAQHTFTVTAPKRLIGQYDPARIAQMLDNLIENAVTYSPEGGKIAVRLWQEATQVHITITDYGIGIPRQDLPHLFKRFHRGANVDDRRFPGWGLGLSMCRQIAEQHGGAITVMSQEGQGSTFHVTLPLTDVAQEDYVAAYSDY
jgi:signal transduction histidine kinase